MNMTQFFFEVLLPVHKCTFCKHQVKLFIHFSPCILDCGGIVQAAYGTMHLGQISAGYNGGRLVIDTNFEACGTPVNKLHCFLRFDLSNRHIYILGCNLKRNLTRVTLEITDMYYSAYISSIQKAYSHVFSCTWVTLDHLVFWIKAGLCDLWDRHFLVVCLRKGTSCDQLFMECISFRTLGYSTLSADMTGLYVAKGKWIRG